MSTNHSFRRWIKTNIIVRLDLIAMATAIALLPFGALFLVHTNESFPRSLGKPRAMTRGSLPLTPTHITRSVRNVQGKSVLVSQGSFLQEPGVVADVRYSSDSASAVVMVDLDRETQFQVHRISPPERIYLDLQNTKLAPALLGKTIQTQNRLLRAIRVGEHERQTTRITLATAQFCDYSVNWVPNSSQLRVELRKGQP